MVPSEVALAKVYDYAQKSLKPSCIEVTKLENVSCLETEVILNSYN